DLLANDPHRGGRDVVILGQLGAGVLDPGAVLILADRPGRDAECYPLEDAVLAQHDPLAADRVPGALVASLLQDYGRLGVLEPAGLDDDAQRHRVADEHHRADLDLGEPNVPRSLVGPGGDRVDRDVLADGRLGGAERVLAGVGAAVGRQDDARYRLAAVRRQHAPDRVAQGRDRRLRLNLVELARLRRLRRALLRRRVEVVGIQAPPLRKRVDLPAQYLLDQPQPRRLTQ